MGLVDLHSHILPGLDDGSPEIESSLAMLRGLSALGFDTVCATPHQKTGQFLPTLEACAQAHQETVARAAEQGLELTIPLAAENMWDETLYQRMENRQIPSYDEGAAFLVEFSPQSLPVGLFQRLFALRRAGKLPVIAHPERYRPLWKDDALVEKLAADCALVVDLGAVAGHHGRREAKVARHMLKRGLAHAAASDAHSPGDVRVAAQGMAWIEKKLGARALERFLQVNPATILAGEHPDG
jgi:protein-tyrosine phosphatase